MEGNGIVDDLMIGCGKVILMIVVVVGTAAAAHLQRNIMEKKEVTGRCFYSFQTK